MEFSGERLKEAMKERNLSLRKVARAINRTKQAVNAWTLGDTTPNSNDLAKLAVVLDKGVSYFFAEPSQQPGESASAADHRPSGSPSDD